MPSSNKPHDGLFRHVFSQPEHAAGELQLVLPAALVARIDWSTLSLVNASVVDEELRELQSDVVFSVSLDGRKALVYVLFEHQSSEEPLMAFRLLRYMVRLWSRWLRDHPEARKLPAILPLLVYHSDAPWSAATDLHELIELPRDLLSVVAPHVPAFSFLLDDLTSAAAEDLGARAMSALGRLALVCLSRARRSDELLVELERLRELIEQVLAAPNGVAAFSAVLSYILQVTELSPREVEDFVRQLGPRAVEAYMTGAQQLTEQARIDALATGRKEGRKEGLKEGLKEGREALLRKLLVRRFGELPADLVARIHAADSVELDRWAESVITAATLEDVFADGD